MQTDLFPSPTLSFSDFWSIWPRKTARQISEKAWRKLSVTNQKKAIQDCVRRYRHTPKQFIPHASTYLNQERWEDEIIEPEQTAVDILISGAFGYESGGSVTVSGSSAITDRSQLGQVRIDAPGSDAGQAQAMGEAVDPFGW